MELWFTERHNSNVGITFRIKSCLLHKKTPYQQLDILESFEYGKIFLLDGLIMLTDRDEFIYHEMITHVPLVTHPDPKHILIIGGGDGGTVREILRHPGVEKIDLVEIDKDVIDACMKYFPEISQGLKDPKVTIKVDDGIKFIQAQQDVYDVIIIDSTDPIGPAQGLFESKFYKDVYAALKSEGIMVAQSESPFQDMKTWLKIYRNLSGVFPKTFPYLAFVPTYPSGLWSFTFGSKKIRPIQDMRDNYARRISLNTRYYNAEMHKSAFSLPEFINSQLKITG